jgi:hypothetical protein
MKRYFVLAGETYYPRKWSDYMGSFDTQYEAEMYAESLKTDWFQVIDRDTADVIYSG